MTLPDIEALLDQMNVPEMVSLLAGLDYWHTVPNERLGIPSIRVTDGPVGARGTSFQSPPSLNTPCGTALAATWDMAAIQRIGSLLGREVRVKGARVHLAPTVNLHRTPVGGRNFECFSEDPYLTACAAVAYINGVQSQGVASCIKHFVGNDTEFERNTIDSRIDQRTLREVYLVPFEAAVRDANVMSVMTSYNRINGPFAADNDVLVNGVLRSEWGFDGLVMSDWFGLHSTVAGVHAGLDLEMPGPTQHRGQQLVEAVETGLVPLTELRRAARNVLTLVQRVGGFSDGPLTELASPDGETDRALIRQVGAAAMVLLRNQAVGDQPVLPLDVASLGAIAVIGPNARAARIMGGGSAWVRATRVSNPLDAIRQRFPHAQVSFAPGCTTHRQLPQLDKALCGPLMIDYFVGEGTEPTFRGQLRSTKTTWFDHPIAGEVGAFRAHLSTKFVPDASGDWQFGLTTVAAARLSIDGEVVIDNASTTVGGSFFGLGRNEVTTTITLESGRDYLLEIALGEQHDPASAGGIHIGAFHAGTADLIDEAVSSAASADLSIIVVGTSDDWESEGWDRDTLALPGRQDELISAVAAVSQRTIVVINAGSPVTMPWLNEVDAVICAWFPGQEMGDALVDLLVGDTEPQGRLPVSFPAAMEDTPAFEHHPGRHGLADYREGRLIGYRWYDTVGRKPLFPFGYGLGYATVDITDAQLIDEHNISVQLSNRSNRDGFQIVQVYAHYRELESGGSAGLVGSDRPEHCLVGFAKVAVAAGSIASATIAIDPRGYQTWDTTTQSWQTLTGSFDLQVGTSSRAIAATLTTNR